MCECAQADEGGGRVFLVSNGGSQGGSTGVRGGVVGGERER